MRTSNSPSYASGNGNTLGEVASRTYVDSDGSTIVIMTDNTVYRVDPDTGELSLDGDLTAVLKQYDATAPGTVQQTASDSSSFSSLLNNLTSLIPGLTAAYTQKQLLQVNLQRAAQGLPPLNAQAYMPGVNVGLSPDTKNMVLLAAAGIGAAIFLSRRKR